MLVLGDLVHHVDAIHALNAIILIALVDRGPRAGSRAGLGDRFGPLKTDQAGVLVGVSDARGIRAADMTWDAKRLPSIVAVHTWDVQRHP